MAGWERLAFSDTRSTTSNTNDTLSTGTFVTAETKLAKASKPGFSIVNPIASISSSFNCLVLIEEYNFLSLLPMVGERLANSNIV